MSIKIIIERTFKEPLTKENLAAIEGFRVPALKQKGYISGETLIDFEDPKHALVISNWVDFDSFDEWVGSEHRKKLAMVLSPFLDTPEKISRFMLGSDALNDLFDSIVHDIDAGT